MARKRQDAGNQPLTKEVADRIEARYKREHDRAIADQAREDKRALRGIRDFMPTLAREHGVEVAKFHDDEGTPETHEREQTGRQRHNVNREIRTVSRTFDLMQTMLSRGTITGQQAAAGRRFRALFEVAGLQTLRAADLSKPPNTHGVEPMSIRVINARQTIGEAIEALGGHGTPAASAAWNVLGSGKTIKDWALGTQLPGVQGKRMGEEMARGFVIAALGLLVGFFDRGES